MLPLYLTIWLGLALFAIGETGRTSLRSWAWWAFTAGLALTIVHTLLAFAIVDNWVHEDAVRRTAMQTEAVFGVAAGWGVYVNYAFLAAWLADAWWWRASPRGYVRPAMLTWTLRTFYLIVIFNGAIVFASGIRRLFGAAIVAWLCLCWGVLGRVNPAPSALRR
jgi:hypothetical protein